MLQIQPRQHALEHAVCVAPILQRKLRRAVGIDALKEPARAVGIDNYLSDV